MKSRVIPSGSDLPSGSWRADDHRAGIHGMDVSEYEDGDFDKWRIWKSIWKNVLWRSDVPEYLYRTGREWTDRICIQLSGFDQGI